MAYDAKLTEIRVSDTDEGPWAVVTGLTGHNATHGREDATETWVYGEDRPRRKRGVRTHDLTFDGLLDLSDTDGQNVLRENADSEDDEATVFVQFVYGADTTGEDGYMVEAHVDEYSDSGDADSDYVECSFTLSGVPGTKTDLPAS